jgi:hypothetical protein
MLEFLESLIFWRFELVFFNLPSSKIFENNFPELYNHKFNSVLLRMDKINHSDCTTDQVGHICGLSAGKVKGQLLALELHSV